MKSKSSYFYSFLINLALIFLGALLFAASFPNLFIEKGLFILAFFIYIPVFLVIKRSGIVSCVFWGAIYGYASYGLFNYWLSVFHPLAGLIVHSIYMVYMAFLFPLLKLAIILFPKRGFLVQWAIWISYEYLKIQGFLGYAYGITAYSQWTNIPIIQIASITGIWGVSALVVFPSTWFAAALGETLGEALGKALGEAKNNILLALKTFFKREWIAGLVWFLLLCISLVFGILSQIDYTEAPKTKMALIQHNTDPWRGGIHQYRLNFEVLSRLSDEAIMENPDLDLVVWSETAFVPRIYWHTNYRDDPSSWVLVRDLLDYLELQDIPFIIGNDDARKDPSINPYGDNRIDYNAAMLFERGLNTKIYRKLHLVPFTEHFPYQKQLPWVYQALRDADTHFWEKGNEATVFEIQSRSGAGTIRFSTPICFEDTFGYITRDFVKNGADIIVNLSNDAWSASLPAQNQHLAMAVFRSVENRRSMVRSTASGQTCAVDPNGRIIGLAKPFSEAWTAPEVPLMSVSTFYTRNGEWLALFFLCTSIMLLIFGICRVIIKRKLRLHHE